MTRHQEANGNELWALGTFLLSENKADFQKLIWVLENGMGPAMAFKEVYGGREAELDEQFGKWLSNSRPRFLEVSGQWYWSGSDSTLHGKATGSSMGTLEIYGQVTSAKAKVHAEDGTAGLRAELADGTSKLLLVTGPGTAEVWSLEHGHYTSQDVFTTDIAERNEVSLRATKEHLTFLVDGKEVAEYAESPSFRVALVAGEKGTTFSDIDIATAPPPAGR